LKGCVFMSKFRKSMSKSSSRKSFKRGARRVHGKNLRSTPMRGGFRI